MDYSQIPFKMIISNEKKWSYVCFHGCITPGPPQTQNPGLMKNPTARLHSPRNRLSSFSNGSAPGLPNDRSHGSHFGWQVPTSALLWESFVGLTKNRWNCRRKKKGECLEETSLEKEIKETGRELEEIFDHLFDAVGLDRMVVCEMLLGVRVAKRSSFACK